MRRANEDAYGVCSEAGIFLVCDGMGGAAAGEVASHTAVNAVVEKICAAIGARNPERLLEAALSAANRAVLQRAQREQSLGGMGTTIVALLLRPAAAGGWRAWVGHAGDSRCYRLRQGRLERCTEDHSLVQEQVRLGIMTELEATRSPLRNVITRAIGTQASLVPEVRGVDTVAGDLFLLCSDGLTREISPERIAELLAGEGTLEERCRGLIDAANEAGGHDNITCVLVETPA